MSKKTLYPLKDYHDYNTVKKKYNMKPEQIYQDLKELAEKLNIFVSEKNFRNTGIKVKSGFCTIKGQKLFIIDKHIPIRRKNELLAECLSGMSIENVFMVPAVRNLLDKFSLPENNKYEKKE